jgi:hypothetical protein
MLSIFLMTVAIEASMLFDSPAISLVLIFFSFGGLRVLDRNYIGYFSYLSFQSMTNERGEFIPLLNNDQVILEHRGT